MFLDQSAHRRLGGKLHDLFLAAQPARAGPLHWPGWITIPPRLPA
jgi:hypothetical protein